MFKVINFEEVTSTMDIIKNYNFNTIVVANKQINGKGKGDRKWSSDKSKNIYMSLMIEANKKNINYFNYSFLTAISVLKTIEKLIEKNVDLKVKWPNDVLINNKKFCGILLEKDANKLIIGLGINLDNSPLTTLFKATNLKDEGFLLDKNIVIDEFVKMFNFFSNDLISNGFNNIRNLWLNYAYNFQKIIKVKNSLNEEIEGIFKDLDKDGTLILEIEQKLHYINSGDIF